MLEEHVGVVGEVLKVRAVEDPAAVVGVNPGHHTEELVSAAIEGARPELTRVSAVRIVGDGLIERDGRIDALSHKRRLEVDGELIVGVRGKDGERNVGSGGSRDRVEGARVRDGSGAVVARVARVAGAVRVRVVVDARTFGIALVASRGRAC
jgi:hypothetical protein